MVQTILPSKFTTISKRAPQDAQTARDIVNVGGALCAATSADLAGDREREAPAQPDGGHG